MASYLIMNYKFSALDGYSFVVGDGDGKFGVVPRTNHVYFQKFDCWLDGSDFLSYQSRYYPSIIHSNKDRYFLHNIGGGRINSVLLIMREMVLVL